MRIGTSDMLFCHICIHSVSRVIINGMYESRHIVVFGIVPVFIAAKTHLYMSLLLCSKKFPFRPKMWYTKSDYRIMV